MITIRVNYKRLKNKMYAGNVDGRKMSGRPRNKGWSMLDVVEITKEREIGNERNNLESKKHVVLVRQEVRAIMEKNKGLYLCFCLALMGKLCDIFD